MSITAIANKVIIRPVKVKTETDSGIILAPTVENELNQGIIVTCGSLCTNVKDGDHIIFNPKAKYSIHEDKVAGENLMILEETDILAVVE